LQFEEDLALHPASDPIQPVIHSHQKEIQINITWGKGAKANQSSNCKCTCHTLSSHDSFGIVLFQKFNFYNHCRNSHALIGSFLLSICGQTHQFEICAMHQQTRAGNLTVCYHEKQIDVNLLVFIDNEFLS